MVTKLSFLFVSFRVKPCEIKIKKWNQFWIETVLLDNFCQKAHFFLDQFLSKTVLLANFCEKAHMNSFTGLDSFTETVQKNWTVSLKLSKIWKYKNHKIPLKILILKKHVIIRHETLRQTALKKTWLPLQNWHACKKTKKTVSKLEKLWQFWKIGNTFLIFPIFFVNVKKKLNFSTKKIQNCVIISTQIFQKHLTIYDFLKLRWNFTLKYSSFTETLWN